MLPAAASADTRHVFDEVLSLYAPVGIVVFVVVVGVLAFVVVRDRRATDREPWSATRAAPLEIGYVVVLVVVAGLLAWRNLDTTRDTAATARTAMAAPEAGPRGLTIRAVAAKWDWRFEYPGGVAQQGDGPARPATLVVPTGGPVRFRLVSRDVEHALWIPAARYKYDAVPGRTNVFDMEFRPGVRYDAARCSEFCGQYHEQMRFRVDARPPGAFRNWLATRQRAAR